MATEETIFDEFSQTICKLCLKKPVQYTCPRCNIQYCSSDCYKCEAHAQCSESFYRDCFMEGLKDFKSTGEDKQKVLEMLSRLDQENPVLDSDDEEVDEEGEDLEERLAGLNLDKDSGAIWRRLTDEEKKEFEVMLKDGRLGNMLELWDPWWKVQNISLVEDLGSPQAKPAHPELLRDIPDITKILGMNKPSETIAYSIVNLIYGYCYLCRLHNGDHLHNPIQTAQELSSLSEGLGTRIFQGVPDGLHSCLQCLHNQAHNAFVSREYSVAVLDDVRCILQGPHQRTPLVYVMAALSDVHSLLRTARKSTSKELKKGCSKRRSEELSKRKQSYYNSMKKVEFLLSWTHKYGLQLHNLIGEVQLEFCALTSELASHNRDKERLEEAWGGKQPPKITKFIEEVTDR